MRRSKRYGRRVHRAHKRARESAWAAYAIPKALQALVNVTHDARQRIWDGMARIARDFVQRNPDVAGKWSGNAIYFDVVITKNQNPPAQS